MVGGRDDPRVLDTGRRRSTKFNRNIVGQIRVVDRFLA